MHSPCTGGSNLASGLHYGWATTDLAKRRGKRLGIFWLGSGGNRGAGGTPSPDARFPFFLVRRSPLAHWATRACAKATLTRSGFVSATTSELYPYSPLVLF